MPRMSQGNASPLQTYWDPRYRRHFYSGQLPPLPPTSQQEAAASTVELCPTARTRRPSILVVGGKEGSPEREERQRQVSWADLDGDEEPPDEAGLLRRHIGCPPVACSVGLLALAVLLGVAFTLWLSRFFDLGEEHASPETIIVIAPDASTTADDSQTTSGFPQTTGGIMTVPTSMGRREATTDSALEELDTTTTTGEKRTVHSSARLFSRSSSTASRGSNKAAVYSA